MLDADATLEDTLAEAWRLLGRGVADRRHGFHTPVLATVAADGAPDARVVVLRGADRTTRTIRIHTDRRSAKVAQIAARGQASIVAYDAGAKVQLRLRGIAHVAVDGPAWDAAWAATQPMSRAIYRVARAPGSVIGEAAEGWEESASDGAARFALVLVSVTRLEWLHLAASGHRRAAFTWDDRGAWTATWLAP